ncbi:ArnT family glycosyltransferase [Zavarzinia sp. CC-PAN008]|uniref:ArnT family glycosyltransferase n=1 Tax=Zavarzinia sp. CC-PAN008 TaxID=3243332 RepID=UPI003F742F22
MNGTRLDLRHVALLVLLALAAFLPGLTTLPPFERDEPRFAQATRQMLETGNFVDIYFQDVPRHHKPVGIYWLQAATVALTGEPAANPIWVYRLPSLVAAILAVLLCYRIGAGLFGTRAAFLGAAILATCVALNMEARLAKTDAVLLACVLLAQGALAHLYMRPPPGRHGIAFAGAPLVFWLAQGAGLLVKGPIVPMISALTVLALALVDRRDPDRPNWRRLLHPVKGVAVMLAVALPWLVLITVRSGGAFLEGSVGSDMLAKVAGGEESHGMPPLYHLGFLTLGLWPGSLLLVVAVPVIWRLRRERAVRFCLAWIVPAWAVFELTPTKLPHYVLPLYPALALLAAMVLERGLAAGPAWWRRAAVLIHAGFSLALAGAAIAVPILADGRVDPAGILAALLVLAAAVLLGRLAWTRAGTPWPGLLAGAAGAALILGLVLPGLDKPWVARLVAEHLPDGRATRVASAGLTEPGFVFTFGTGTRLVQGDVAAGLLLDGSVDVAVVEQSHDAAFRAAAGARFQDLSDLGPVQAFNYSQGRMLDLHLYRRAGAGAAP